MHRLLAHRLFPALVAASLTVACGTALRVAGIEGTGDSNGSASGYGSLFVNGREFDTSLTEFRLNGASATEADIKVGMQTSVQGDLLAEQASSVSARRALLAPIDGIARVGAVKTASLSVLGQNVRVDEMTRLIGITLDELDSDMLVDIHALVPASGEALATYLAVEDSDYSAGSQPLTLTGFVDTLSATELTIGSLTVDVSAATVVDAVAIGDRVTVTGQQPTRGGTLFASVVTPAPAAPTPATYADRAVVVDAIDGSRVRGGQTEIELADAQRRDTAAQSIDVGTHLLARGPVDDSGLLNAADYWVIPAPDVLLHGVVASLTPNIQVLDQALNVQPLTQYIESRPGQPRQFSATDLQLGDALALVGYFDQSGQLVVTRMERTPADPIAAVYGVLSDIVAGVTSNTLVIGGVNVITDDNTVYESVGGTEMSETVFLATATTGLLVQAWGEEVTGAHTLLASRVRLLNSEEDIATAR